MEPIELTCAKCGKGWKLIKAGAGPVTCPHCKAPLGDPRVPAPAQPVSKEPTPNAQAAAALAAPAATLDPTPATTTPVVSGGPGADVDDPALAADFDDQFVQQRQPGKHPLVRVIIILLALFILVPLAVFLLFAIVCAIMIAAR
ncbi:MAG TPA: hypothetical protein VKD71_05425 [Gemmataceae bacterium]|nr:hypothetical protein [Gemmataceae bacterium]